MGVYIFLIFVALLIVSYVLTHLRHGEKHERNKKVSKQDGQGERKEV